MKQIPLSKGAVALVDDDDYEALDKHRWHLLKSGYAARGGRKNRAYMHHEVVGKREGLVVDHINRNKLDNRKLNLRHATQRRNIMNQALRADNLSGVTGVSIASSGLWEASCKAPTGCKIHLGSYITLEEAVAARVAGMRVINKWEKVDNEHAA